MQLTEKKTIDLANPQTRNDAMNWLILLSSKQESLAGNLLLLQTDFEAFEGGFATTPSTNGRFKILLDYEKLNKVGGKTGAFVLFHELMHNVLQHFTRPSIVKYNEQNHVLVNIVIDYFVNKIACEMAGTNLATINQELGASLIDYASLEEIATKLKVLEAFKAFGNLTQTIEEEVLELFFESEEFKKNGQKFPCLDGSGVGGDLLDDHKAFEEALAKQAKESGLSPEELREVIKAKANAVVEAAVNKNPTNNAGNQNSPFLRELKRNRKKRNVLATLKIKQKLGKLLTEQITKTYAKASRRQTELPFNGYIKKGKQKLNGNKIIVAIDVSGSLSDDELAKIWGICEAYLTKSQGELGIIYWSSCPIEETKHYIESATSYKQIEKFGIHSSGGTMVEYLFEWIEQKFKTPITLVNITDMFWSNFPPLPTNVKEAHHLCIGETGLQISKERYPKINAIDIKD